MIKLGFINPLDIKVEVFINSEKSFCIALRAMRETIKSTKYIPHSESHVAIASFCKNKGHCKF